VWPFLENLVDTAQVTRYAPVDTAGNATIRTYAYPNRTPIFIFVFKRGIGPSTVAESDGRTGFPWYGTHHTLRDATVTGTRHDERGQAPKAYSLYQNYPNPFNPVTSVSFDVQSRSYVTVEIFDTMGRRLSTIVSETLEPGRHVRQWNALGFSSGTYFCRMKVGGVVQTRSLLLVK
jgi:hypothetical protein